MNFRNKVKQKLKNGQVTLGGWSLTGQAATVEIPAITVSDWVLLIQNTFL